MPRHTIWFACTHTDSLRKVTIKSLYPPSNQSSFDTCIFPLILSLTLMKMIIVYLSTLLTNWVNSTSLDALVDWIDKKFKKKTCLLQIATDSVTSFTALWDNEYFFFTSFTLSFSLVKSRLVQFLRHYSCLFFHRSVRMWKRTFFILFREHLYHFRRCQRVYWSPRGKLRGEADKEKKTCKCRVYNLHCTERQCECVGREKKNDERW